MRTERVDTQQKAVRINLDSSKYGTFAEIGAGQEVARWFFRVGGASGTVAKSISAYDMAVSDAIYGPSGRYVSRTRLERMLDLEYRSLAEHVGDRRGDRNRFFAFADTVAARSFTRKEEGHGWMGIRLQDRPGSAPSQILLHLRLLDRDNLLQQEALGILGVNLIHSTFYASNPVDLVRSLLDDLGEGRVEADLIEFSGPAYAGIDNRRMAMELVRAGLSGAAMFTPSGAVIQPAEAFYKKAILLLRGRFRPVTNLTVDMLHSARAQFAREPANEGEDLVVVTEMTLKNLLAEDDIGDRDFLDRVDLLRTLGSPVMISSFGEFYRLANYLQRLTTRPIGLVMGVPTLREIFDEGYYLDLAGGILESFGRLFKNDLRVYAYPVREPSTGEVLTADNFRVAANLQPLYDFLLANRHIRAITDYRPEFSASFSRDVYRKLREGDATWVDDVPPGVALLICQNRLLGYDPDVARTPC